MNDVQFIVKNATNNMYVKAVLRTDSTTGKEIPGNYKVEKLVENKDEATKLIPGEDGVITLDGIEAKSYEVTEVHTAPGYALLEEAINIEIYAKQIVTQPTTAVITGQEQEISFVGIVPVSGREKATATVNGEEAYINTEGRVPRIEFTVINNKKFENPFLDTVSTTVDTIGAYIEEVLTGDNRVIYPYVILIVVSVVVICVVIFKNNKNKNNKNKD